VSAPDGEPAAPPAPPVPPPPGALPERVIITSARTRATRAQPIGGVHDLREQTRIGELQLAAIVRAQLRLALIVCSGIAVVVGGLPLLFATMPELRSTRVLGLGLPWLLLGVCVYPLMVAAGWLYVRHAERADLRFAHLVDRR
jgi:hypothetical protein